MPARDFLLDDAGNRVVRNGDFVLVTGASAVQQGVRCSLRLFRGEDWLDQSQGTDYMGVVFVPNANPLAIKAELARAIAVVPDVEQVTNTGYSVDPVERKASIDYSAITTEGKIEDTVTT